MKVERPACVHADDRGSIIDVLENVPIDSVTVITVKADTARGNHYHKETTQWVYILEGSLRLVTQTLPEPVKSVDLQTGDLAMTVPMECHALYALTDSTLLVLTKGPRRGRDYEADTYRLSTPLIESGDLTTHRSAARCV